MTEHFYYLFYMIYNDPEIISRFYKYFLNYYSKHVKSLFKTCKITIIDRRKNIRFTHYIFKRHLFSVGLSYHRLKTPRQIIKDNRALVVIWEQGLRTERFFWKSYIMGTQTTLSKTMPER